MTRLLLLALLVGCSSDKEDSATPDSGEDTAIEHIERPESCTPEVKVDGTPVGELDDPRVGDSWTVFMYCDGALQVGTYSLQADPPELVSVDSTDPVLTFVAAGSATIDYRMGSRRADFTVTIVD